MNKVAFAGADHKVCHKCGKDKPLEDFFKAKRGLYKRRPECKLCKTKYIITPEKRREYHINYRHKNPMRTWAQVSIKSHYRSHHKIEITWHTVYELALITPKCLYCGSTLDYTTPSGSRNLISMDNLPTIDRIDNSSTLSKENIRILCCRCNTTKHERSELEFYKYCKNIVSILDDKYE